MFILGYVYINDNIKIIKFRIIFTVRDILKKYIKWQQNQLCKNNYLSISQIMFKEAITHQLLKFTSEKLNLPNLVFTHKDCSSLKKPKDYFYNKKFTASF